MLVCCVVELFVVVEEELCWYVVQFEVVFQFVMFVYVVMELFQVECMDGIGLCEYCFFCDFVVEVVDVLEEYYCQCIVCVIDGCVECVGVQCLYVECVECGWIDVGGYYFCCFILIV